RATCVAAGALARPGVGAFARHLFWIAPLRVANWMAPGWRLPDDGGADDVVGHRTILDPSPDPTRAADCRPARAGASAWSGHAQFFILPAIALAPAISALLERLQSEALTDALAEPCVRA